MRRLDVTRRIAGPLQVTAGVSFTHASYGSLPGHSHFLNDFFPIPPCLRRGWCACRTGSDPRRRRLRGTLRPGPRHPRQRVRADSGRAARSGPGDGIRRGGVRRLLRAGQRLCVTVRGRGRRRADPGAEASTPRRRSMLASPCMDGSVRFRCWVDRSHTAASSTGATPAARRWPRMSSTGRTS